MDEVQKLKSEFAAASRKDGGNLQTRDFTDDIYEKGFEGKNFVPETSEMFCNLIAVIPNAKMLKFREDYSTMMSMFYENQD